MFSTELFAFFIITLPAGLVGYLLQLPILLPNIINLFELFYSFPYFSNVTLISLPFSVETSYPISHSTNIFILCTLSPHTPFAWSLLIKLPLTTCLQILHKLGLKNNLKHQIPLQSHYYILIFIINCSLL